MIESFLHQGLQAFFESGSTAGIPPQHAGRLARRLAALDAADGPQDMNRPGWGLHPQPHDPAGHYAVWVSGFWRLSFRFEGSDAVLVNYQDFH